MPSHRFVSLRLLAATASFLLSAAAHAQAPIKIGEINSYKALPQNLVPYKQGWLLAQEEINAAGGVLGRKLETVFRDDNGNPGDAVRVAEELLARENVELLAGVTLSHVGLALTDFAKQRKVFFLASGPLSDKVVWDNGNRYTYRLRSGTYALSASVIGEAIKLKKKRWALIYPNYEYGQAAVAAFKENMKKAQPDIEFVAEQAPALGKIDAGAVAQAIGDQTGVILVAHGAAGPLVPSIVAASGPAVRGAIFVDATLPHPGRSWLNTAPPELADGLRAMTKDGLMPPWDRWFPPGALARLVRDPALLDPFTAELEPLGAGFFDMPAPKIAFDLPSAYLQLSSAYATEAVKARAKGWPLANLDLNHPIMLTHPAEVLSLLQGLAADLD